MSKVVKDKHIQGKKNNGIKSVACDQVSQTVL